MEPDTELSSSSRRARYPGQRDSMRRDHHSHQHQSQHGRQQQHHRQSRERGGDSKASWNSHSRYEHTQAHNQHQQGRYVAHQGAMPPPANPYDGYAEGWSQQGSSRYQPAPPSDHPHDAHWEPHRGYRSEDAQHHSSAAWDVAATQDHRHPRVYERSWENSLPQLPPQPQDWEPPSDRPTYKRRTWNRDQSTNWDRSGELYPNDQSSAGDASSSWTPRHQVASMPQQGYRSSRGHSQSYPNQNSNRKRKRKPQDHSSQREADKGVSRNDSHNEEYQKPSGFNRSSHKDDKISRKRRSSSSRSSRSPSILSAHSRPRSLSRSRSPTSYTPSMDGSPRRHFSKRRHISSTNDVSEYNGDPASSPLSPRSSRKRTSTSSKKDRDDASSHKSHRDHARDRGKDRGRDRDRDWDGQGREWDREREKERDRGRSRSRRRPSSRERGNDHDRDRIRERDRNHARSISSMSSRSSRPSSASPKADRKRLHRLPGAAEKTNGHLITSLNFGLARKSFTNELLADSALTAEFKPKTSLKMPTTLSDTLPIPPSQNQLNPPTEPASQRHLNVHPPFGPRVDSPPGHRFIKNKKSGGGSALMKKFFPGDEEEDAEVKPAPGSAVKKTSGGWQRIDGGPSKMDLLDAPPAPPPATTGTVTGAKAGALPPISAALPAVTPTPSVTATSPTLGSLESVTKSDSTKMDVDLHSNTVAAGTSSTAPRAIPTTTSPSVEKRKTSSSSAQPATIPSAPLPHAHSRSHHKSIAAEDPSRKGTSSSSSRRHEAGVAATRDGEIYEIMTQVGEGTFGQVYKARNSQNGSKVALKKIRLEGEKDGFPVTAMREIKLLQSLRHENVVKLHEIMVSKNGSVYMVFEYMDHDLTGILSQQQISFSLANLKSLSYQMFAGIAYLHHKGVIHRDMKGSNILINSQGELKLADFGLARIYQKRRRLDYTNRVITLWYRPPELLLGTTVYGPEVDMWSVGCIFLELFVKKPIFQGNDDIHQLEVIWKVMGTPTIEQWPAFSEQPWYELVKPREILPSLFRKSFIDKYNLTPAALDLVDQLLAYDPSKRISASEALDAPFFTSELPEKELLDLARLDGEWHEYESKRERERSRRKRAEEKNREKTAGIGKESVTTGVIASA